MKIDNTAVDVLRGLEIDGHHVKIVGGKLDRKTYKHVNDVLEALGGKWNRKMQAHVFEHHPANDITAAIDAGEVVTDKDMGFFPTPPELARYVVASADIVYTGMSVLEPSAGNGALALVARDLSSHVFCVEMDPRRAGRLVSLGFPVHCGDFMAYEPKEPFDRVVMNPPFGGQADIDHVTRAFGMLAKGGRLAAIMSGGTMFRSDKKTDAFRSLVAQADGYLEDLPDGSFKEAGTAVKTCLAVMVK
jgi:predicted RNA methylase